MIFVYPAVFHKENDAYWVEFPDLKGCQTYGDNINRTMESAQEAMSGYLLTLLEEKRKFPIPTDIKAMEVPADGFTTLVSSDVDQYKDTRAVKKTLTIPSWLNDMAMDRGLNFSKILQEALLVRIQTR